MQNTISKVFWWLFIKPPLGIAKCVNVDKNSSDSEQSETNANFTTLDLYKLSHKILWGYLQFGFKINSVLGGTVSRFDYYKKLINWNQSIPILGYVDDKTTFAIQLLMEPIEGRRKADITFLSVTKYVGTFRIVSKELVSGENQGEITVTGVWTSGSSIGKSFNLSRHFIDNRKQSVCPSSMYFPPKIIICTFELIMSASAILVVIQLFKWILEQLHK